MKAGRIIVALGVFVTVVGGAWAWAGVSDYHDASERQAAVEGRLADVQSTIDAQLDDAVGHVSVTARRPASEDVLEAMLDDLMRRAEADPTDFRAEILERHREVLDDADDGVLDERLVAGLIDALRDLEREVVRPLSDATDDAYDTAPIRAAVVTVVLLALWIVLFVLSRTWGPTADEKTGTTGERSA